MTSPSAEYRPYISLTHSRLPTSPMNMFAFKTNNTELNMYLLLLRCRDRDKHRVQRARQSSVEL